MMQGWKRVIGLALLAIMMTGLVAPVLADHVRYERRYDPVTDSYYTVRVVVDDYYYPNSYVYNSGYDRPYYGHYRHHHRRNHWVAPFIIGSALGYSLGHHRF